MNKFKTVKAKQLIVFLTMILLLILLSSMNFYQMKQFAVSRIYAQMQSQAEYYVNSFEYRLEEIMRQQSDFFGSRQLSFLADERILDDYDRREALLTVRERLDILESSDIMIKEAILYIPNSKRVITSGKFQELDEEWKQELEDMIPHLGMLYAKEGDLIYSMAEAPYSETFPPYFYLYLSLDRQQMIALLDDFTIPEGGTCWYKEEWEWFLANSADEELGRSILAKMEDVEGIQKVRIDGGTYLVNVIKSAWFGTFIQYCPQNVILKDLGNYTILFWSFLSVTIVCAVLFSGYTERVVNRPLKKLYEAFKRLRQGDMTVRVSHSSGDEFSYIYEGFNHAVQELERNIELVYMQKQLVTQAELKQLQSQINPHFLYNTFFMFKGRVERRDYEGAKALAEYLGNYFIYLTKTGSDTLRLADDMHHAESYARIQECRFAARISLIWEPIPQDAMELVVPRLIVQPVLENAYKYGLENREEDGVLHVFYKREEQILNICIENNGIVTEETIQMMQYKLSDAYKGEVTGMLNIHRRLKNFLTRIDHQLILAELPMVDRYLEQGNH